MKKIVYLARSAYGRVIILIERGMKEKCHVSWLDQHLEELKF